MLAGATETEAAVHGYTTAFWWSAAIVILAAVVVATCVKAKPQTDTAPSKSQSVLAAPSVARH